MRKYLTLLLWVLAASPLFAQTESAANVQILRFDQIEERIKDPNNRQLKVVNFWATWCRPCVKELPYFEQLRGEYAPQGVEVVLVSVDFPEEFETRVRNFVAQRGIESEVLCMNETNANGFINRINPDWSGAIPATLLVAPGGEYVDFHAGEFTYESLQAFIKPHLPKK